MPLFSYALTGGTIFDGACFHERHAVIIRNGIIESLVCDSALPAAFPRIHAEGALIAPGFVDVQINGCGGVMFNDAPTPETLRVMADTNLRSGCTAFLPTLITASDTEMRKAMAVVDQWLETHEASPVLGLHLEGPYISTARKGIHDRTKITTLSPSMRDTLAAFAQKIPLLLTLAPECVAENDIRMLSDAGVVIALGHSDATYEEALCGVNAGAKAATHLFNAMSPWQGRYPGMTGAMLDSPEIHCGLIADGHHVHYASLGLAKRLKGDSCFLVTDATAPVGTNKTAFSFCGENVFVQNGKVVNADGTLGGSLLTMIEAVGNCVRHMGWDLGETLRMASLYPAKLMGYDSHLGKIAPGCRASLALFRADSFTMTATVENGVFHRWHDGKAYVPEGRE